MTDNHPSPSTIMVWDLPTRLFHWILVAVAGILSGG